MNRQLEDFLERHEHLMHEDLQELVAIPSVSDDIENVKKALEATLDLARKYGFEARSVLNDQVGIIEKNPPYLPGNGNIFIMIRMDENRMRAEPVSGG